MSRRGAIICLALGACFFDHAGFEGSPSDGGSADMAVGPDVPPGPDGGADAAFDATPCVEECAAPDTILDCSSGVPMMRKCDLGCVSGSPDHCASLVPSNSFDPTWVRMADAEPTVPAGETWVFDTDTGRITRCGGTEVRPAGTGVVSGINFQTVAAPPMGAAIGVFALTSITVEQGALVRGVGVAAFGLLAGTTVTLLGAVTVAGGGRACDAIEACLITLGNRTCGGPGGSDGGGESLPGLGDGGGTQGAGGSASGQIELGGGGGAFFGAGGQGGGNGGAGGMPYGALEPLIGGSGGGSGGDDNFSVAGWGGGGGGAIQITALASITITELSAAMPAGVRAGGAGGGFASGSAGGGGGGSGGGIFLEAPTISIEFGRVAANGGGGGGTPSDTGAATPVPTAGAEGTFSTSGAAGGDGTNVGGAGGAGGNLDGNAGNPFLITADSGSGGGGGVGRITIKTAPARFLTSTPQISPAATIGTITTE